MPNTALASLRKKLSEHHFAAYIIPSSDPHQSEYVAEHWKSRRWISGFTGSMGNAVVTLDHAGVWTDSRYFLQAEKELPKNEFALHKLKVQGAAEHVEWLAETLPEGSVVGCDGKLFTVGQLRSMQKTLGAKGISVEYTKDLIGECWKKNRPSLPDNPIFEHDVKFAGRTRPQKLAQVREKMAEQDADFHLISTLDDIAWLYNIRGTDVESNPLAIFYAIVGRDTAYLFVREHKVPADIRKNLETDGVTVKDYDSVVSFLEVLSSETSILIDKQTTSIFLFNKIKNASVVYGDTPSTLMKAIKNETEIGHIRNAMIKDGVALTKAIMWLEATLPQRGIKETEIAQKLIECRGTQEGYYGESFDAIVGYKGNGAIIHYKPEEKTCATVRPSGILLLDSGGQYLDGTTDITRTFALSRPTAEQKKCYTLVLRGHIGLAMLQFPHGTKGVQMDILARQPLWEQALNYGHGTGHGVGFFLNVHEPPQGIITGIAARGTTVHEVGMLSSNEPGFYKVGEFGIRIENLILVRETVKNEYGQFLNFETVTLFPIETKLIDKKLLEKRELAWLNAYHEEVYEKLSPRLNEEEKAWLKEKCKAI
ncbi:MAG: hypothetical protein RLZZ292_165 [Bacteroidota bacterium]|jgi:Xaa-Pro aminopeptidase